MIPAWLVQLGSIAGLLTFGFTIIDRLLPGRPVVSLARSDYGSRNVRCSNLSSNEILVKSIRTFPGHTQVARDDSTEGIARATLRRPVRAVCAPGEERDFPLIFLDGQLMDEDANIRAPFIVMLFWQKTRSVWFLQVPVIVFTSAKTIRHLQSLKPGKVA